MLPLDFLCYPRFDPATIFAALLDDQREGASRFARSYGTLAYGTLDSGSVTVLTRTFSSRVFCLQKDMVQPSALTLKQAQAPAAALSGF